MSWVGLSSFPEFVVVFWIAGFCHVLRWSVVISLVCGHFLARGLWSWPGWVCGHFLRLWFISWIVFCGHVMGGSVVIFWVCGHFLARGAFHPMGESKRRLEEESRLILGLKSGERGENAQFSIQIYKSFCESSKFFKKNAFFFHSGQ